MNTLVKKEYMEIVKNYYIHIHEIEKYEQKYIIMKLLMGGEITNGEAAVGLGKSIDHIKRMKRSVKKYGYESMINKAKGKSRNKKFSSIEIELIISLYNGEYARSKDDESYNFTGYSYSLFLDHFIKPGGALKEFKVDISYSTLRKILISNGYRSEKTKRFKEEHSKSGRASGKTFELGERWETDGKKYDWLNIGEEYCAHNIYCRGIKRPIATYFDKEETTYGYMKAFEKALINYGIPELIISDERGTFINLNARDKKDKYNTRMNNVFDLLGIKYRYSSNPNAKPGVERWNRTMEERLPLELRRKGIKSINEMNEYIDEYIKFEQAETYEKADKSRIGRKVTKEEYIKIAIIQRDKCTVGKNHRVMKNKKEYEILKNGQLRTMSKGKKGYFLKDIEGNEFIEIDKIRYEAEISTRVPESSYKKKEVKNYVRKGKEAGTVVIMQKEYVLIRTDGSYIEIPTGVEIDVSEQGGEKIGYYDNKAYKLLLKKEYELRHELVKRKYCSLKFHCLIKYEGMTYVVINENGGIKYFADEVKKVYVRYVEDGIYAIVDNYKYRIIKEKEFDQQKSGQIPLSNHSAERIRSQNGLK